MDDDSRPPSTTALSIWLKANGVSRYEMARRVKADPKQVKTWETGRVLPNLVYAFRIEQATKGGVPASSWLGTPLGRMMWNTIGLDWAKWMAKKAEEDKRNGRRRKGLMSPDTITAAEALSGPPQEE